MLIYAARPKSIASGPDEEGTILKLQSQLKKLLNENLDKLNIMADALLKYETISIEQIDDIMEGATPREPKGWSDDSPSGKSSKKTTIKGTAEEL